MTSTPDARIADAPAVVLRGGTVLTMDAGRTVLTDADVLVVGERIEAIGHALPVPEGTVEVDARGGIVMPGMIDTHRHMWQTAMRGYGADWTLTQYFVWYDLEWGKSFRPEDVYAGNLLSAIEAVDAGVTTSVDWSHGLQSTQHADAALDALEEIPGRFVLAYGNIQQGPWEWSTSPEFQDFVRRRIGGNDLVGFQLAFDVTGDPTFPERAAFEAARELGVNVTTHAGVWAITKDESINLMYDNGFMTPGQIYVHSTTLSADSYHKIAASGGFASVSTESESSAGQGYPPTWQLRKYGVPISLSMDTSVWWSADLFNAMRSTANADRVRVHMAAHEAGDTVVNHPLRAETVVEWATIGGAKALGIADKVGSIEVGKQADIVLIKNDASPAMFPVLNPYGHVVYQAGRGDVHTVLVNGTVLKHDGRLVGAADKLEKAREVVGQTVDHLQQALGDEKWVNGMNPELAPDELFDNPYQYSDHEIGAVEAHDE